VAHVYGSYDQQLRVTFRAEQDDVLAFGNLGDPYFRAECRNVVGLLLNDCTDWEELRAAHRLLLPSGSASPRRARAQAVATNPLAQGRRPDINGTGRQQCLARARTGVELNGVFRREPTGADGASSRAAAVGP